MEPQYRKTGFDAPVRDARERVAKKRLAVTANAPPAALVSVLHQMTGHEVPSEGEVKLEEDSIVRVLGWRVVQSSRGKSHLVYTILAANASRDKSAMSEARLVQRRYRDFVKLHAALAPRARCAGLRLPSLPSKIVAFGRNLSPTIAMQRQKALHEWLSHVVSAPILLCDDLRLFLGLSPEQSELMTTCRTPESTCPASSVSEDEGSIATDTNIDLDPYGVDGALTPSTPRTAKAEEHENVLFAVNLAELERQAVDCMLDDDLWGR